MSMDLDDPGVLTNEDLEAGICSFAARLAAASCRFLLAVAEYDRREAWASWECRSMAHWLAWKCQMSLGTAREQVRVAAVLGGLPLIRARFAEGRLSYSQVRALSRVATRETEAELVELAGNMTGAQIETVVRAIRRVRAAEAEVAAARRARRHVTTWWDDDGTLNGRFSLPPEDGAVLLTALD